MEHLVLVRHGETDMNAASRSGAHVITGQFPSQLTTLGQQQAVEAGRRIAAMNQLDIWHAISSDLDRARHTAQYILNELPHTLEITTIPALRERDHGSFEGKTIEEIRAAFPQYFSDPALRRWRLDWEQHAPGGENLSDVTQRVRTAVREILNNHGDTLIVSHKIAICCLLTSVLNLPKTDIPKLKIPHATPLILRCQNPPKLVGEWPLERLYR